MRVYISFIAGVLLFGWQFVLGGTPLTTVHPSFDLTTIRPSGFTEGVGGMDLLPDGRLLISISTATRNVDGAPKKLFAFSNVKSGNQGTVSKSDFAKAEVDVLGIKIVNGNVFGVAKHKLIEYLDNNKDGYYEGTRTIAEWGSSSNPGNYNETYNYHHFNFGLLHEPGFFYVTTGVGWDLNKSKNDNTHRGYLLKIDSTSGQVFRMSGGLRTPAGVGFGPNNDIFATDNQGNWMPTSKLNHLQVGKFYGYTRNGTFPLWSNVIEPPVVWFPHSTISNSPTYPIFVKKGVYKDQMLVGDIGYGGLQRIFLERINNKYQGCIFRFTGGLESGVFQLHEGMDGEIYIGGLGDGSQAGWGWKGKKYGLQRLDPNETSTFEMLAIRSVSSNQFEIEFTQPVFLSGASNKSKYTVKSWSYTHQQGYGQGKSSTSNLTVTNAEVSADKKKVTLTLSGLQKQPMGTVVHFSLSGILSGDGKSLWQSEAFYTLHNFGPAEDLVDAPDTSASSIVKAQNEVGLKKVGSQYAVHFPESGEYEVSLWTLAGKKVLSEKVLGNQYVMNDAVLEQGMHLLKVTGKFGTEIYKVLP